jgi:leucyl/phenylalanyl-tRNA---protein transferase
LRQHRYDPGNRADPGFPWLGPESYFPFPDRREWGSDGLVAVGGNLSPGMLLSAYRQGVFPWFGENDPILWQSPEPRFVLFPQELHCSESMRKVIRRGAFEIRLDTAFDQVIDACSSQARPGQSGTWITPDMVAAYSGLHALGYAHSVEAWSEGTLAGGFYGIALGKAFFGESMFHRRTDAAKAAFIPFAWRLMDEGYRFIDSQARTEYMASLGAREIPRDDYLAMLEAALEAGESLAGPWTEAFPDFPRSTKYDALFSSLKKG